MTKRGYRTMNSVWDKIVALKPSYNILPIDNIYPEKFNQTYKEICFYNLLEKYICGGIKDSNWEKVERWKQKNIPLRK